MLDDLLLIKFQQLFFEEVAVLLTYWPMAHQAEPNTHLYSSYLRHTIPGLRMAYTVTDFSATAMKAVEIDEDTVYRTNDIGITEPAEGEVIEPQDIDLVFVPFLACDKQGNRVGFGKGFYDRYLAQCRDNVLKIGFSYFEPVEEIKDVSPLDVPLNFCITPQAIYEF